MHRAFSKSMNACWTEFLGYAAAGGVLATFSVRSMTALRSMAIASNLLFIAYAALAGLPPVLLLHALLLPLNLLRLCQVLRASSSPERPQRPSACVTCYLNDSTPESGSCPRLTR